MSAAEMVGTAHHELELVREAIVSRELALADQLALVHESHRDRARNLVHYWAFREAIRPDLHERLQCLGLDPLLDVEWDVTCRLDNVVQRLREMSGAGAIADHPAPLGQLVGRKLIHRRTDHLFGPAPLDRDVRIMVTLATDGKENAESIKDLHAAGTDCFRINCARDTREAWTEVIGQVRGLRVNGNRPLIFMDLGGSKLRVTSCSGGGRSLRLSTGSTLFISRRIYPSSIEPDSERGPYEIAVSDPSALAGVLPGHHVWFDDGKIGGVVRERSDESLRLEITYARNGGRKLRLERGVNLPDTPLRLPALTRKDLDDLPFAARHADFLALSFIRTPADVEEFRKALQSVPDANPVMVIKIETREALTRLPEVMLAAMRHDRVAILLARGDLGVECGIVDLPRIQRELLSYCAAASLPLFWATGVLERASRTGEPTRAEITDAIEAAHAQCVMLNKGTNTLDALRVLRTLLTRSNANR